MATVRSWISENVFAVAAVVLPLLIVVLFALAVQLPRWWVEDPAYDLLFSVYRGTDSFGTRFQTSGNRVIATVSCNRDGAMLPQHSLYRFSAAESSVSEVDFEIPEQVRARLLAGNPERDFVEEQVVVNLAATPVAITAPLAPDGYRFRDGYDRGPGLFGELFGIGRHHGVVAIEKSGRVIEIEYPMATNYYYDQIQLLGWIDTGRKPE